MEKNITLSRKQLIEIAILVIGIILLIAMIRPHFSRSGDVYVPTLGTTMSREEFEKQLEKEEREWRKKLESPLIDSRGPAFGPSSR